MSIKSKAWIIEATNSNEQAIVSECDWLELVGYSWSIDGKYFRCNNKNTWNGHQVNGKRLHWFIAQLMGLRIPDGYTIDHIDRNPLNNQRSNLRVASKRCKTTILIQRKLTLLGILV